MSEPERVGRSGDSSETQGKSADKRRKLPFSKALAALSLGFSAGFLGACGLKVEEPPQKSAPASTPDSGKVSIPESGKPSVDTSKPKPDVAPPKFKAGPNEDKEKEASREKADKIPRQRNVFLYVIGTRGGGLQLSKKVNQKKYFTKSRWENEGVMERDGRKYLILYSEKLNVRYEVDITQIPPVRGKKSTGWRKFRAKLSSADVAKLEGKKEEKPEVKPEKKEKPEPIPSTGDKLEISARNKITLVDKQGRKTSYEIVGLRGFEPKSKAPHVIEFYKRGRLHFTLTARNGRMSSEPVQYDDGFFDVAIDDGERKLNIHELANPKIDKARGLLIVKLPGNKGIHRIKFRIPEGVTYSLHTRRWNSKERQPEYHFFDSEGYPIADLSVYNERFLDNDYSFIENRGVEYDFYKIGNKEIKFVKYDKSDVRLIYEINKRSWTPLGRGFETYQRFQRRKLADGRYEYWYKEEGSKEYRKMSTEQWDRLTLFETPEWNEYLKASKEKAKPYVTVEKFEDVESKRNMMKRIPKSGPVLLDFFGDWCKPCKKLEPFLYSAIVKLNQKYPGLNLKLLKFSSGWDKSTGFELGEKFDVASYPTLILFNKGRDKARIPDPDDRVESIDIYAKDEKGKQISGKTFEIHKAEQEVMKRLEQMLKANGVI
jgi:thiol-disulfide isomerase/thioredoxin